MADVLYSPDGVKVPVATPSERVRLLAAGYRTREPRRARAGAARPAEPKKAEG